MYGTPSQIQTSITANYTALVTDDAIVATSAVTTPITVTLYAVQGQFGGYNYVRQLNPGQVGGLVWVVNNGSSVVTVAPAGSDIILGPNFVGPGMAVQYFGDGATTWIATQAVPSSAIGLSLQVPISSANILAMFATPVQMIAAPGAGKVIVVDSITTKLVTTATQYANGGAVIYQYDNTANGAGTNAATGTIPAAQVNAGAGTSYQQQGPIVTASATVLVVNKGVFISNQTAAFITGTGTAVANIKYRVLTP